MKKPSARLQAHQEKRKKKKLARRKMLAAKTKKLNLRNEEDKPKSTGSPRSFRRRKELEGLTYWRGAREVLKNH